MNIIDLHLVSWNRPKMTDLVIKTIHRNTKRENFRLTVLDNGSDDDTLKMLQGLSNDGLIDELVVSPINLGLEAARDFMREKCTYSEYFVCIDNDILPPPILKEDWLEQLVDLMEKYEDYVAIACRYPVMVGTGNIYEQADINGDDIVEFPHPGGSLRIMKTNIVDFVGGWDRKEAGRGSEERYICGKLNEAGFKTGFATNIHCLHLWGDKQTDNWGYPKDWKPEDTGHSPGVWHPVFDKGDDPEEIIAYSGKELAECYLAS